LGRVANLKEKSLSEFKLPLHSRTRDTARRGILRPLGTVQGEEQLIASTDLVGGESGGAWPMKLDPNLALVSAEAHVRLGDQQSEALLDRVEGPGDGDLAADDARLLVGKVGAQLGNWGWLARCQSGRGCVGVGRHGGKPR
jgi:hypothetical protein